MYLDNLDSIVELVATLTALTISVFFYIGNRSRRIAYAIAIFLCGLISEYYWTCYLLIVGDTPNVSDVFYYSGWNIGYLLLLFLLLRLKSSEERRYFNPLMLIPIPLNIWQLTIYLPFGGVANNIYQVTVMTAISVLAIQGICWHFKNKSKERGCLYVFVSALVFSVLAFGMWTSSCFDGFIYDFYYVFSFLLSINYIFLAWTLIRSFAPGGEKKKTGVEKRNAAILKLFFITVLILCTAGGLVLGLWLKSMLKDIPGEVANANLYDIITVTLFIISLVLAFFAIVIIVVVNLIERSAEINRLTEARLVADRANEAKSEFLANMSHEIRTPINTIMGMNEMIMRESIRDGIKEITSYAQDVESAGKSLLYIINDILDFSKIEAGKLEIVNADYSLGEVLNDINTMISFKAGTKGLDFYIKASEAIPDGLCGDEGRLRQIMINLLNNAVKYTDKGSVELIIGCEPMGWVNCGDTINLFITVKDTGIGIREEDLQKLFGKFERVDLQRNSTVEGTGLGLAITRNLVELMGGNIEVESVYGKGSTFTATVPQKVASTQPLGNLKTRFANKADKSKNRREMLITKDTHILVVDDTYMNLLVVKGLLKETGITIDTASSGRESVEMAKITRYDIILMDQRMPGMEGTEALRLIREQKDGPNLDTPVICLTADAVSGAREKYLAEGFTDYLTKPILVQALEEILMKYLPKEKIMV